MLTAKSAMDDYLKRMKVFGFHKLHDNLLCSFMEEFHPSELEELYKEHSQDSIDVNPNIRSGVIMDWLVENGENEYFQMYIINKCMSVKYNDDGLSFDLPWKPKG